MCSQRHGPTEDTSDTAEVVVDADDDGFADDVGVMITMPTLIQTRMKSAMESTTM